MFQAGFHTLTPKIFLQQISDFPIHRGPIQRARLCFA